MKQPGAITVLSLAGGWQRGTCDYPICALSISIAILVLTLGVLAPLQLLGIVSLFLKGPIITRTTVICAALAGTGMAVFALAGIRLVPETALVAATGARTNRAVNVVIALTVFIYAALWLDCLFSFPNGYDPMVYHLDVALKWLQTGSMRMNPAWGWKYCLPGNAELPALAALSAGLTRAVAIGNLAAAFLLATSVYLVAWRITGARNASVLAAIVSVTIPMVIYQAIELDVDLFGTAFLLAGIALLVWRDKGGPICDLLSGCAAGIAVGAKPVFWIYAFLFVAGAFAKIASAKPRRLKALVLVAAGLMFPSGFWFVRAAAATGNPWYPMKVSIGHHELLPGYDRKAITAPRYGIASFGGLLIQPWKEPLFDKGVPVGYDRGTGPLVAGIVVPGMLFLVLRLVGGRASRTEAILFWAVAAAFLSWYTQALRVPRFGLPILALSCALAAPMIQAILIENRRVPVAIFVLGVALNGLFCMAQPVTRLAYRYRRHDWSRSTYYGYPPMIDKLPVGSRIFDATRHMSFALAGAKLTNYVLPDRNLQSADILVEILDPDPPVISQAGTLLYDDVPPSLYPKVARRWRVYRLR